MRSNMLLMRFSRIRMRPRRKYPKFAQHCVAKNKTRISLFVSQLVEGIEFINKVE